MEDWHLKWLLDKSWTGIETCRSTKNWRIPGITGEMIVIMTLWIQHWVSTCKVQPHHIVLNWMRRNKKKRKDLKIQKVKQQTKRQELLLATTNIHAVTSCSCERYCSSLHRLKTFGRQCWMWGVTDLALLRVNSLAKSGTLENFHLIPNVRMVNFECQSVDFSPVIPGIFSFLHVSVIYMENIGKIVYLKHLPTSNGYWHSDIQTDIWIFIIKRSSLCV